MSRNNPLLILIIFLSIYIIKCIDEDEDDYYKLLGVNRDASTKEIKKAFRALSLKYHPDRNPGDKKAHDLYIKINRAHEVLTDPEKKEIYDIYGEEGLNKEGNIQQRGKERGPNAKIDLFVELADLYNGITRTIEFEKNVICKKCHGTGGKLGKTKQCPVCNGRGVMMRTITMGIGMQMQMQQPCERCGAKGVIFSENCPYCQGRKIVREKKKIEIVIEKGMENEIYFLLNDGKEKKNDLLEVEKLDKISMLLNNIDNNINQLRNKKKIEIKQVNSHNQKVTENNKWIVIYSLIEICTMITVFMIQKCYINSIVNKL